MTLSLLIFAIFFCVRFNLKTKAEKVVIKRISVTKLK